MGCDIHAYPERKTEKGFVIVDNINPFRYRNYGIFGFLAGVRNYSEVTPIAEQRGLPNDASIMVINEYLQRCGIEAHSASWLTIEELHNFDYNQPMEDRRNAFGEEDGEKTTFRDFLGKDFFKDIHDMKAAGVDRIVFWFDS